MRIAVTRLMEKSGGTRALFARYGHESSLIPTMKTAPVENTSSLDDLCKKVSSGEVDFLLFSSTLGVDNFFDRCPGIPEGIVMVAVGPMTSEALRKRGFNSETIPSFSSDHFASHLGERIKGKTVGIVRPDVPNPALVESLISQGAQVIEGIAYLLIPSGADFKNSIEDVDAVIFTSGKSFTLARVSAQDLIGKIVIAIGPKTARVMRQRGVKPDIVADGTLEDCLRKV